MSDELAGFTRRLFGRDEPASTPHDPGPHSEPDPDPDPVAASEMRAFAAELFRRALQDD